MGSEKVKILVARDGFWPTSWSWKVTGLSELERWQVLSGYAFTKKRALHLARLAAETYVVEEL